MCRHICERALLEVASAWVASLRGMIWRHCALRTYVHIFPAGHITMCSTLTYPKVSEMAEEQELRDIFERFGRVTRVFLAKDRETGRAKGFAFISFVDRADAASACDRLDGFGYKHLILKVEFAKKQA
jgi:hypothetical protein